MRMYRLSLCRAVPVAVLLLVVALTPGAQAADEDMAMMAEHPIVGTWIADSSPEDSTNAVELSVYGPGGTIVNIGPGGNTAGSWVPTGERTADTMIQNPMSHPEGGSLGLIIVRGDAVVAEDGQSFTGTWTVEFPAAMVEAAGMPAGQLGPGEVTAYRVNVEPMGEPVAPWPLPPPPEEGASE
jgi:hypothetical protein